MLLSLVNLLFLMVSRTPYKSLHNFIRQAIVAAGEISTMQSEVKWRLSPYILAASMASLYATLHLLQLLFEVLDPVQTLLASCQVNLSQLALTQHACSLDPCSSDRARI